ncbi:hypothetical protein [Haloplanus natans]|uniref:hypothetical protein n=1 Tax=Haloplanus natans TaxID=376171 RepID=UPI000677FC1A|nr:hypothetical protein [Haloplanus natans]
MQEHTAEGESPHDSNDDAPATFGIASTTTDPMELDVSVEPLPYEGRAKLQLLGEGDRPRRGVSTTAFLPPAAARKLGEELIAAAGEVEREE